MSTCIRGGVRYKRHNWKKQEALADVTACTNCGQIKGGVFEQRDQESSDSGVGAALSDRNLPEVSGADGGLQVRASDSGDADGRGRLAAT
jgi:hypothetical protein